MSSAPLPVASLQTVSVGSVVAALANLDIKVSTEDLLKALRDQGEVGHANLAPEPRGTPSKLILYKFGSNIRPDTSTASKIASNPTEPYDYPYPMERRRLLVAKLSEEIFPTNKILDPLAVTLLEPFKEGGETHLPFIYASRIVVEMIDSATEPPPRVTFENVQCLWDTGAQSSYIATSMLDATVRGGQTEGSAMMYICFAGMSQTMDSIIQFRPHLPNNTMFIILGQSGLLNRLEYKITPSSVDPEILEFLPEVYGQIDLISWRSPANDELVPL